MMELQDFQNFQKDAFLDYNILYKSINMVYKTFALAYLRRKSTVKRKPEVT